MYYRYPVPVSTEWEQEAILVQGTWKGAKIKTKIKNASVSHVPEKGSKIKTN